MRVHITLYTFSYVCLSVYNVSMHVLKYHLQKFGIECSVVGGHQMQSALTPALPLSNNPMHFLTSRSVRCESDQLCASQLSWHHVFPPPSHLILSFLSYISHYHPLPVPFLLSYPAVLDLVLCVSAPEPILGAQLSGARFNGARFA